MLEDNYDYFKNWYLELTRDDRRISEDRTRREVNFLEKILDLPKGAKMLDLCCGHGRHLILLAKKYDMTGLDMDEKALEEARAKAKENKVSPRIVSGDMRDIPFRDEFDAVVNMFTSFGYFNDDSENLKVLKEINMSLKNNGLLVLDLRNKKETDNFLPRHWFKHKDKYFLMENSFNESSDQEGVKMIVIDEKGGVQKTGFSIKLYSLDRIMAMLNEAGFSVQEKYGSIDGAQYSASSNRMILLAKKVRGF